MIKSMQMVLEETKASSGTLFVALKAYAAKFAEALQTSSGDGCDEPEGYASLTVTRSSDFDTGGRISRSWYWR